MKITLLTVFVFLVRLPLSSLLETPYTITPISSAAGIFYQNLGNVKTYSSYINLLSYTNLTFYNHKFNLIKNIYLEGLDLCHRCENVNGQRIACNQSLHFLELQINQANKKFDTIIHLTDHALQPSRKRRGLIDGVSSAFKWLFGTPDANDAKYYSDAINSLQNKNRATLNLMHQQIHIMSSAIVNYNNSVQSFKINENELNRNIQKFNNFSKTITNRLNEIVSARAALNHLYLLTELTLELNEEYDVIIASILFAKQHILHPFIITPTSLKSELSKIKLNANVQFPIPLEEDSKIHRYFSLSEISVIYDNTNLIYVIRIPLADVQSFALYKLVPLPSPSNQSNVFSYIDPAFPFLMMSITKTHYGQLRDISSCMEVRHSDFLCPKPMIFLSTQRPICEVILRTGNINQIPDDCPTKSIKAEMEVWHQLTPNQWLYIVSNPTPATVSCETNVETIMDITLRGTGLLELRALCKCYTMTTSLAASSNISSQYANFIPDIDITLDNCCIGNQRLLNASLMAPIRIDNINLDELRHAKHKLDQFDDILRREINQPFLTEHYTAFGSFIGIITLMFFSIILLCCCSRYCCDCTWIPFIGRCLPQRRSVMFLPHHHKENITPRSSSINLTELPNTIQNQASSTIHVNEAQEDVPLVNTHPNSSQPVVCNPYNLRSRRSTGGD